MENRGSKSSALKSTSNCKFTLKRSNPEKGKRAKKRETHGSSSSSSEDDTEVVNTVREKKEEVDVFELVYGRRHQGRHEVGLQIVF